jgi:hypothetical protein
MYGQKKIIYIYILMSKNKKSILQNSESEESEHEEVNDMPVPVAPKPEPVAVASSTSSKHMCPFCTKCYTRPHSLKKHINENRCVVKLKAQTEKLSELQNYEKEYGRKLENKKRAEARRLEREQKKDEVKFVKPKIAFPKVKKQPVKIEVESEYESSEEESSEEESSEEPPPPISKKRCKKVTRDSDQPSRADSRHQNHRLGNNSPSTTLPRPQKRDQAYTGNNHNQSRHQHEPSRDDSYPSQALRPSGPVVRF